MKENRGTSGFSRLPGGDRCGGGGLKKSPLGTFPVHRCIGLEPGSARFSSLS
jgi:hypothetical protein